MDKTTRAWDTTLIGAQFDFAADTSFSAAAKATYDAALARDGQAAPLSSRNASPHAASRSERRQDIAVSTIVVTGASAGIGLESALQLGADGHHLVLVGRHGVRLADAAEAVRAAGATHVDTFTADFASLDSVRTLGRDLLELLERIDVLVDNAGTVFARRTVTDDGLEATFAVNHVAGFLLTELLKERLVGSAPARIVITSSVGHYNGTLDLDDLGLEHGYSIMRAYSRSKSPTCCTPGRSRPSWPPSG